MTAGIPNRSTGAVCQKSDPDNRTAFSSTLSCARDRSTSNIGPQHTDATDWRPIAARRDLGPQVSRWRNDAARVGSDDAPCVLRIGLAGNDPLRPEPAQVEALGVAGDQLGEVAAYGVTLLEAVTAEAGGLEQS